MAFRLNSQNQIECDTVDEVIQLRMALVGKAPMPDQIAIPRPNRGGRRDGSKQKAAWAEARKLAKKDGIPIKEARSRLAQQKAQ